MPPPDFSISESSRRVIAAFGQDAAGAAFNMALKKSIVGDDAEELRWLGIAVEVMRVHRERCNTIAQIVQLAALGATAVR
jgi:hypothetical protein